MSDAMTQSGSEPRVVCRILSGMEHHEKDNEQVLVGRSGLSKIMKGYPSSFTNFKNGDWLGGDDAE